MARGRAAALTSIAGLLAGCWILAGTEEFERRKTAVTSAGGSEGGGGTTTTGGGSVEVTGGAGGVGGNGGGAEGGAAGAAGAPCGGITSLDCTHESDTSASACAGESAGACAPGEWSYCCLGAVGTDAGFVVDVDGDAVPDALVILADPAGEQYGLQTDAQCWGTTSTPCAYELSCSDAAAGAQLYVWTLEAQAQTPGNHTALIWSSDEDPPCNVQGGGQVTLTIDYGVP